MTHFTSDYRQRNLTAKAWTLTRRQEVVSGAETTWNHRLDLKVSLMGDPISPHASFISSNVPSPFPSAVSSGVCPDSSPCFTTCLSETFSWWKSNILRDHFPDHTLYTHSAAQQFSLTPRHPSQVEFYFLIALLLGSSLRGQTTSSTRAAAGLCHSTVRRARSPAPSRADWTCPPGAVLRACLQAWSSAGTGELGLERVASELRGPDCLCKQCDLCQTPAFILEVCTLYSRRQSVPVWGAPSKNAGAESLVSLPSQQFCTHVVTAVAGGDQTSPEWFSAGGLLPDAPVFTPSTVPLAGSAPHPLLP